MSPPLTVSDGSAHKLAAATKKPRMPLTTEAILNSLPPLPPPSHEWAEAKGKPKQVLDDHRHRRSASQAHRRQRSSIALPCSGTSQALARPSVMGVFEDQPEEVTAKPPTQMLEKSPIPPEDEQEQGKEHDEEYKQVAARLSAFSFASKPAAGTFPPRRRQPPRLSSQSILGHELVSSPLSSPTSSHRFSNSSSRSPSLLLARPSSNILPPPTSATGPSSPPAKPKKKRHSHTRSNSISLPNIKLQNAVSRPNSLNLLHSPSFDSPASPTSPNGEPKPSRLTGLNSQRLKFEPSGRGAEAEKQREESRRRALEKLTGSEPRSRPPFIEPPVAEISLPDLDDEDSSSVASSNRPLSGAFGQPPAFSWSSQPSLSFLPLPPLSGPTSSSPLSASPSFGVSSAADEQSIDRPERWSGQSFGLPRDPISIKEEPLGYGMDVNDASIGKRPGMNRQLSALQEVDESEEDEEQMLENVQEEAEAEEEKDRAAAVFVMPTIPPKTAPESTVSPSGLRELRLSSSLSTPRRYETQSSSDRYSFPQSLTSPPPFSVGVASNSKNASFSSPTKTYGTIGRGRPGRSSSDASASSHGGGPTPKRTTPTMGFRGSISYRKDASSSSGSRELGGDIIANPTQTPTRTPTVSGIGMNSPSPSIKGMSANTRGMRPCPRVRLTGDLGSGRVLGGVNEMEEGEEGEQGEETRRRRRRRSSVSAGIDFLQNASPSSIESGDCGRRRPSSELFSQDSLDRSHWRDVQLEMERENESLRDELGFWKVKCRALEERLENERKEGVVLRDRVRKLGDRLSSISSLPTERSDIYSQSQQAAESRLIAEMREQLFTLTGKLQQEHRAKEMAFVKLNDLRGKVAAQGQGQQRTAGSTRQDEDSGDEILFSSRSVTSRETTPSLTPPQIELPTPPPPPPTLTSSKSIGKIDESESISKRFTPDFTRLKSWGFPATTPIGNENVTSKEKKRESFFGLSNPLRRTISDDGPRNNQGIDLPPFVVDDNTPGVFPVPAAAGVPPPVGVGVRAVSDPTSLQSFGKESISYLPGTGGPAQFGIPIITVSDGGVFGAARVMCSRVLDFRKACKCCVGDVIEV
ncbi:hypothetical protein I312_100442 [Cryptococcus bacillisporus CA1280]|uniref:Uncharacterized protein n=1 Tax=Cryptococcus bacillisporus CA1280 TaxID=1296109 RepID=A0A0D0TTK0_CRYGA|nr:hypothetical protein I312_01026 [Cryptococcus bacillisporus CA1280]